MDRVTRRRIAVRGQIALPPDFLRRYRLAAGDNVEVEDTGSGILITPLHRDEPVKTDQDATTTARPTNAEIARRQALFARVMARRAEREIRPLSGIELVRRARTGEGRMDDRGD